MELQPWMGKQLPSPKGAQQPPLLAHVYCGRMARRIKMPLGMGVGLGPGHIVLDGASAPSRGHSPSPNCLLWPNGRPSQLLLSACL